MADFSEPRVTEKRFLAIPPQALTTDGTTDGVLTVLNTYCWKVGQVINCVSNAVPTRRLKIKAVISETEIKVGDINTPIYKFSDVSDLLMGDNAMIELTDDVVFTGSSASNKRPVIHIEEINRQVYEEEPTVALRSHLVDWLGRSYDTTNPIPVQLSDGNINIGTVEANVEVHTTHLDNSPEPGRVADSMRIGDGVEELQINPDGSINVAHTFVKTPKTIRIATTTPNTEQSYTFTTATKRFRFRVEDSAAKAQIAFAATESGTDYWTVNRGSVYEDKDIDASLGITIYFQVNKANQTVQIVYWE